MGCTKLKLGDVCYSGGVETGPIQDYSQGCPTGSACFQIPGMVGFGGEVPKVCMRVKIAEPCPNPAPQLCMIRCPIAQKKCPIGFCAAKIGSCCQTQCQQSSKEILPSQHAKKYAVVKG